MSTSFSNKTVIVTGGAGGLGFAIVQAFLAAGANVVATDIQDTLLGALPAAVEAEHKERLLPYKCDSSDDAGVQKLVSDTVARFGRLDILVNNAGILDKLLPLAECTRHVWDSNLLVNLTGPFVTSQNAVRQYLSQELVNGQRGTILNVISTAGNHGGRAGVAYTASKHGLVGLTKSTAAFYGPKGIRSVGIMPGAMPTNISGGSHDFSQLHPEGMALSGATCQTWQGEPGKGGWNLGISPLEQVAKTVLVLCSDGMNTINGALVPTDMGWAAV
ncbi:bacilysin biosynthesis oxidoreductase bacC [Verticillium alfalfae VaMs.102]|uniref:Bacilysin biosynthesis oxidoreductase bacC n=1 Tax=Verticillium alfalfae (strain VaMs.102 / ATCC MYA-4576 / FGSC 10136) TaxID=526221 RepID=C9SBL3_VERA1|nr:bacilysin biosynthesis oxidoreductase bacC [Verticillium alfalfae VaMs.102]EEY15747.1 bacilysin biosynthesis oxidoreductase bacC [Verticillium alfalfae VaMs.102]